MKHILKGESKMLVYDGTKSDFLYSVEQDTIAYEIEENIYRKMNRHTACNGFLVHGTVVGLLR